MRIPKLKPDCEFCKALDSEIVALLLEIERWNNHLLYYVEVEEHEKVTD